MKYLLILLIFTPLSISAQTLDSLQAQTTRSLKREGERRKVDSAFSLEIPATELSKENFKRFRINDSVQVVRQVMPLNEYTTTDSIGNSITIVDVRFIYTTLPNQSAVSRHISTRKAALKKEADAFRRKAEYKDKSEKDEPPNSPLKSLIKN